MCTAPSAWPTTATATQKPGICPSRTDIPAGYATEGTWYEFFARKAAAAYGVEWGPGFATFQYPNENRASTIWYHDHALGMTRLNVYAGPAGFYLIRGGPAGDDAVRDSRTGGRASLPGPAPRENDKFPPNKPYREIPIAIQDRSFNADGSLFYPDTREFFDGVVRDYIPEGEFSPIWNPEFFGNTIMVNGNTWPFQTVEKRRYRFRFLNGCQSRFLILDFNDIPGVEVWQIGNEGGFLAAPVNLTADHGNRLLMGLAERADVIVDFGNVPAGNYVLGNVGPDEPFGGGVPGVDFPVADPGSTGQVMQFRVVPAVGADDSTPPQYLQLPTITPLPAATLTRQLALIEEASEGADEAGEEVEGPVAALLGTVADGVWTARGWMDPVTENPSVGSTEIWEIYNATADAHPMHIHEVAFEVVNREGSSRRTPRARSRAHRARRRRRPPGAVGDGLQGHGHRVPGSGHPREGPVQDARPVRLALPHRRARGQRDDASLSAAARPARSKGCGWLTSKAGMTGRLARGTSPVRGADPLIDGIGRRRACGSTRLAGAANERTYLSRPSRRRSARRPAGGGRRACPVMTETWQILSESGANVYAVTRTP